MSVNDEPLGHCPAQPATDAGYDNSFHFHGITVIERPVGRAMTNILHGF
jgi:hypothetical protein